MSAQFASTPTAKKALNLVTSLQSQLVGELVRVFQAEQEEFQEVSWVRDEGRHGGGCRMVASSQKYFNRASVNISQVHYEDQLDKKLASATAISTIIHPWHPQLPSIHMHISWTEMKSGSGYWRVMADLNPAIPREEDKAAFLKTLTEAGGEHAELGQKQGDQYFHIPALNRHRGVAHFYLEGHNSGDFERDYKYAESFGGKVIQRYGSILESQINSLKDPTAEEKQQQLSYHSVYFLQVLTLDRGTTSGLLVHNQNDVGTLGSIPSHVNPNLIRSWVEKLPEPQNKLLDAIVSLLPDEDLAEVTVDLKQKIADQIREHYKAHPKSLDLQAKGFTVPDSVANHQK